MLSTLEQLRDKLASSLKDVKPEVAKRSAYNFIYGVSVFSFFRKKGIIKIEPKSKRKLTKSEKVKFALQYVQTHFPEFFCVDLPEYDKDDYTLRFPEPLLLEVAQEVHKLNYSETLGLEEFWKVQENFFISSF